MQRRDINAADAPAPAGQYTQAVEVTGASRTLYLSGQVGIAADGSVPEDAEAQCALAWRNLQAQLRAAGMEIENLVKITTIVRDPADVAKVRAGRAAVLGTHRAGEHANHRRSQQSSLESRGGGHRSRLKGARLCRAAWTYRARSWPKVAFGYALPRYAERVEGMAPSVVSHTGDARPLLPIDRDALDPCAHSTSKIS